MGLGNWLWQRKLASSVQLGDQRNPVSCIAISRQSNLLASAGLDGHIRLWDTESEQLSDTLAGHRDAVARLAFSVDGTLLVSAGKDGRVGVWEAGKGQVTWLPGHQGPVRALAFSEDGELLVSGGQDRIVRFWQPPQTTPVEVWDAAKFGTGSATIADLAFAPGSRTLAVAFSNGAILFCDWEARRLLSRSLLHRGGIAAIAYAAKGTMLASAGGEGVVRVWNLNKWTCQHELEGHEGEDILALACTPQGKLLASGGGVEGLPGELILWHPRAGTRLKYLTGHKDRVTCLAFKSDELLASGGADGTVRLWRV